MFINMITQPDVWDNLKWIPLDGYQLRDLINCYSLVGVEACRDLSVDDEITLIAAKDGKERAFKIFSDRSGRLHVEMAHIPVNGTEPEYIEGR